MTIQETASVQCGVEIIVPLGKLKKSPRNARRTPHPKADIEALAASIAVKGVLQPPVVAPERDADGQETGAYLVTIGEGRRLALMALAKRKQITKNAPIRCLLDEANDAFEVSLDENVTRTAMHPADQFEAFRELAETNGWSAEDIGARFGISAHTVRQRLRLGAVSPKLMAAYRAGELSLDQLMSFAVSEDHDRQTQVLAALSYNRSPSLIRRLMTEQEVEALDRRAQLIGAEVYAAAGGRIRRDLFVEDNGGWFEDVGLLDRLVLETLSAEAERVKAEGGWAWAEAHVDYPHAHGLRRLYPAAQVHDDATKLRLAELAEEYDGLIADGEEGEALSEEVEGRLTQIDAELQAASEPIYDPAWVLRAGVFVVLDWEGEMRIERGFVRAEDEARLATAHPDNRDEPNISEDDDSSPPETRPKPLSDRLIADLTAHRTAALRDALADNPDAAFLAALHALVLQAVYFASSETCLQLAIQRTDLGSHAEGYAESVAGRGIEQRHARWGAALPPGPDGLWETLDGFSPADRMSLFAHCVSLSVNAVRLYGGRSAALAHAEVLADHLDLDMSRYWQATAASYFGRVSKAHILEAVREGGSPEVAHQIERLKKDAMAQAAAELLGPENWLPNLLHRSRAAAENSHQAA